MKTIHTRCCIAGGGPAGMVLGLLLARAGVPVVVLEKHADFFRDFRGDTVHPSTLEVMHELGLLEKFLQRPHDKARELKVNISGQDMAIADFSYLKPRHAFIAMMPQWEFLDFIRDEAQRYPSFQLQVQSEVTGLIEREGRIKGVHVDTPDGAQEIMADLVIGADGRHSTVRDAAGLKVIDQAAPIDVLWMRIPKLPSDPSGSGGRIAAGRFLAMIDRETYWQCAYVIHKGGIEEIHAKGLPAFRQDMQTIAPLFSSDRLEAALPTWDEVKLLSVKVDRLVQWWRPGLLCIGDAAHAMSPIGGVGINLAIQDAVATANLLSDALADSNRSAEQITPLLAQVQKRRLSPARVTQAVQVTIQNRLLQPILRSKTNLQIPWAVRLFNRFRLLRALPAYAVGIGVRPEHVRRTGTRRYCEDVQHRRPPTAG